MGEGAICHPELVSGSQETIACHSEPTGEIIQPTMADGWQEARKASNLDGKKIRRYEGKLFTLKSLSSNPPTLLSSKQPSPQPLSHEKGSM